MHEKQIEIRRLASLGSSSVRRSEELVTAAGDLAAEAEAVLVARDLDFRSVYELRPTALNR